MLDPSYFVCYWEYKMVNLFERNSLIAFSIVECILTVVIQH